MADNKLAALMGEAVADLEEELEIERSAKPIVAPKPAARPSTAPAAVNRSGAGAGGPAAPYTATAAPAAAPQPEFSALQSSFAGPSEDELAAEAAAQAAAAAAAADAARPDDFGIVYKKRTVPGKDSNVPATVLADEKLFEAEAKASAVMKDVEYSAGAAGGDDDEFDFEFDDDAAARPARGLVQSAQERARERKKLAAEAEAKAAKELQALREEAARLAGVDAAPKDNTAAAGASGGAAAAEPAPAPAMQLSAPSGALGALAEGDEDEEDEEDEDEEEEEAAGAGAAQAGGAGAAPDAAMDAVAAAFSAAGAAGPDADDDVEAIAAEFDEATRIVQTRAEERGVGPAGGTSTRATTIKYQAALRYFVEEAPLQRHLPSIVRVAPDSSAGCCTAMFKTKLAPERALERDNVLCIAKTAYDHTISTHQEIMATLFKGITGIDFIGTQSTWEAVGFQRADFTTDLRGGGMLGPFQMVYLCEKYRPFVQKLYALAQHPVQNFTLMAQSLSMTIGSMQALRMGRLNHLCNARGEVYEVVNQFFGALWFEFYDQWTATGATIARMHEIMPVVLSKCNKDPAGAIARFNTSVANPKFQGDRAKFTAMD